MFARKPPRKLLSLAALYLILSTASAVAAEPAVHGHDEAEAPARLSFDAGEKWASDAPLRKAMANVRKQTHNFTRSSQRCWKASKRWKARSSR